MDRRTLLRRLLVTPIVAAAVPFLPRPDIGTAFGRIAEAAERTAAGMLTLNIELRDDFGPRLKALSATHGERLRAALHAEGERIMAASMKVEPLDPHGWGLPPHRPRFRGTLLGKDLARRKADELLKQYAERRPPYALAIHETGGKR